MPVCSICGRESDEGEAVYCYDCDRPLWESVRYRVYVLTVKR
ncbi:MAG: hypothetical protein ACE5Z5_01960 [Candidatus Bathyarchaeia archaeon]